MQAGMVNIKTYLMAAENWQSFLYAKKIFLCATLMGSIELSWSELNFQGSRQRLHLPLEITWTE